MTPAERELASALHDLGIAALRLKTQRDYLADLAQGFSLALVGVLELVEGELEDELAVAVAQRSRAIVQEWCDLSNEKIEGLFGAAGS